MMRAFFDFIMIKKQSNNNIILYNFQLLFKIIKFIYVFFY